jgi:hypothetical protein
MGERLSGWEPARRMIETAQGWFELEGKRLSELLDESDRRLDPFKDPLRADFGTHRWLKPQREEAYSDWLAWILERLESAERIFRVLGINQPEAIARCGEAKAEVKRERVVAEGHQGHQGRMDIVVLFLGIAVIGVEVKPGLADRADIAKHRGYGRWLEGRQERYKPKILIAAKGDRKEYNHFALREWAGVCVDLREIALSLRDQGNFILAAMTLAFVGAVERNLLGLGAPDGRVFDARTGDHVQSWLKKEGTHG